MTSLISFSFRPFRLRTHTYAIHVLHLHQSPVSEHNHNAHKPQCGSPCPLQFSILFFLFEFSNVPWASSNTNPVHSHYSSRGCAKYCPDFYGRKSLLAKHPTSPSQWWNYRCILPIGSAMSASQMRGWNLVEPGVCCTVFEQLYWSQKAFSKRLDHIPISSHTGYLNFSTIRSGDGSNYGDRCPAHCVNEAKYGRREALFRPCGLENRWHSRNVTPQCRNINCPTICLLGFWLNLLVGPAHLSEVATMVPACWDVKGDERQETRVKT